MTGLRGSACVLIPPFSPARAPLHRLGNPRVVSSIGVLLAPERPSTSRVYCATHLNVLADLQGGGVPLSHVPNLLVTLCHLFVLSPPKLGRGHGYEEG